jgi:hypothetical protein
MNSAPKAAVFDEATLFVIGRQSRCNGTQLFPAEVDGTRVEGSWLPEHESSVTARAIRRVERIKTGRNQPHD